MWQHRNFISAYPGLWLGLAWPGVSSLGPKLGEFFPFFFSFVVVCARLENARIPGATPGPGQERKQLYVSQRSEKPSPRPSLRQNNLLSHTLLEPPSQYRGQLKFNQLAVQEGTNCCCCCCWLCVLTTCASLFLFVLVPGHRGGPQTCRAATIRFGSLLLASLSVLQLPYGLSPAVPSAGNG